MDIDPTSIESTVPITITVKWATRTEDVSSCDPTADTFVGHPIATGVSGSIAYSVEPAEGEQVLFWPQSGLDFQLVLSFETDTGNVIETMDVEGCIRNVCNDVQDCRTR